MNSKTWPTRHTHICTQGQRCVRCVCVFVCIYSSVTNTIEYNWTLCEWALFLDTTCPPTTALWPISLATPHTLFALASKSNQPSSQMRRLGTSIRVSLLHSLHPCQSLLSRLSLFIQRSPSFKGVYSRIKLENSRERCGVRLFGSFPLCVIGEALSFSLIR